MTLPEKIPVFLLSGFLGAGKSTLLNQLLEDPEFHDSAIVINEFGDVPVDHLLVRQGETSISQVSTGCLCCSGSTDLTKTLFDLHFAAFNGQTNGFSRVIVEMSGLGDPAPLVNALANNRQTRRSELDATINNIFYLAGFVTLYDAINGAVTIDNHFEAVKQIAFADKIVLSKTDQLNEQTSASDIELISNALSDLNSSADIIDRAEVNLTDLFQPRSYSSVQQGEDVIGWLALEEAISAEHAHNHSDNSGHGHGHDHNDDLGDDSKISRHAAAIRTFSIVSDKQIDEQRFHQFLSVLQNSAGPRLLRVKGIISTQGNPEQPLIIHAVQHLVADPKRLESWPDDDRRTRLVFITNGVDPQPVRELFFAIIENKGPSFGQLFHKFGRCVAELFNPSNPQRGD
jgi:G3E family GTPase